MVVGEVVGFLVAEGASAAVGVEAEKLRPAEESWGGAAVVQFWVLRPGGGVAPLCHLELPGVVSGSSSGGVVAEAACGGCPLLHGSALSLGGLIAGPGGAASV